MCAATVDDGGLRSDLPTAWFAAPQNPDAELPRSAAAPRFSAGEVLAERYRIVNLLGRGGMGEVYCADDLKLSQSVALKFLPEKVEGEPSALARFLEEVKIARQITHPHVCRVFDIGEASGLQFLSMEHIKGEDLSSQLRRLGRLPNEKAVEIGRQLCAGLAAVHDRGILHRDLKPSNVILDEDGQVRLTDFGLAASAGSKTRGGTPAYMAPELWQGQDGTVQTDLYSLGLVLYEVFTGERAFRGSSRSELAWMHAAVPPIPPSQWVAGIDPGVEGVILACLEKAPDRRPASPRAVAEALPELGTPAAAVHKQPSAQKVAAVVPEPLVRLIRLGTYLGALIAFIAGYFILGDQLRTDSHIARALVAGLPLIFTLAIEMLPRWLRYHREQRLINQGLHGTMSEPGYFRLIPYEEGDEFERPDNAHHQIFQWLRETDLPILYLTGRSGTGKSSLLNAWVIPRLLEENVAVYPLVVRSFQKPVRTLLDRLKKSGSIWQQPPADESKPRELLEKATDRLWPKRLLVILDQFEEFVILHSADGSQRLGDLLRSLTEHPIPGLTFLIVLRSDYTGLLSHLKLPPLRQFKNWREVSPFTLRASKKFLLSSGLEIGSHLLDEFLCEASEVEGTQGLIRPISLNILGIVLDRVADSSRRLISKTLKPRSLIRGYLRDAVNHPDIRAHSCEILRGMISDAGTKRPIGVKELADSTHIEPVAIRGCLLTLGNYGLVRPIDRGAEIWEISHDFVARILDQILPKKSKKLFQCIRPWLAPTALVLWLIVVLSVLPFYRQQIEYRTIKELSALGALTVPVVEGYRVFLDESFDESQLARVWSLLRRLEDLQELELSDVDAVSELKPLQDLTSLRQLSLINLFEVSELEPLRKLANLQKLTLSELEGISEIEVLRGLINLQELNLLQLSGISDLEPVGTLHNLRQLSLIDLDQVRKLAPLRELKQLEELTISNLKVSKEELSALRAALPGLRVQGVATEPPPRVAEPQKKADAELNPVVNEPQQTVEDLPTGIKNPQTAPFVQLPDYASAAKRARVQGNVKVRASIDKQGNVEDVNVLLGLPMGLTEAVVDAVRQWSFEPAILDGEPVDVDYDIVIGFEIPESGGFVVVYRHGVVSRIE